MEEMVKLKEIRELYLQKKGKAPTRVRIYEVATKYGLGFKIDKNWWFSLFDFNAYLDKPLKGGRPKNGR